MAYIVFLTGHHQSPGRSDGVLRTKLWCFAVPLLSRVLSLICPSHRVALGTLNKTESVGTWMWTQMAHRPWTIQSGRHVWPSGQRWGQLHPSAQPNPSLCLAQGRNPGWPHQPWYACFPCGPEPYGAPAGCPTHPSPCSATG